MTADQGSTASLKGDFGIDLASVRLGYQAYLDGRAQVGNPYDIRSEEGFAWDAGWRDAEGDSLADKAERAFDAQAELCSAQFAGGVQFFDASALQVLPAVLASGEEQDRGVEQVDNASERQRQ